MKVSVWNFDNDAVIGDKLDCAADIEKLHEQVFHQSRNNRISAVGQSYISTSDQKDDHDNPPSEDEVEIVNVPFKCVFKVANTTQQHDVAPVQDEEIWKNYLKKHGNDLCMIKDLKVLHEMVIDTSGIPDTFRGSFW